MLAVEDLLIELPGCHVGPLSFRLAEREYLVLLGPSGVGKSTLLEWVAGLRPATRGRLLLHGRDLTALPPERRGLGVVFQEGALFPHMNVRDNLLFPLRARGAGADGATAQAERVARLVRIGHRLQARPAELSSGEIRRAALGRALATGCRVMLLDEPLEGLDPRLRRDLRLELHAIARELELSVLHVTHSLDEAFAVADRVALLLDGRLAQVDTPSRLLAAPASVAVARYLMIPNVVQGEGDAAAGLLRLEEGVALPAPVARDGPLTARFSGARVRPEPCGEPRVPVWVRGLDRRFGRWALVLGLAAEPRPREALLEVAVDRPEARRGDRLWLDLSEAEWRFL